MRTPQVTIKTTPTAQQLLRMIAAQTSEKQYQVLERVLHQEWARLQQQVSVMGLRHTD
jgi:hypothetical protein